MTTLMNKITPLVVAGLLFTGPVAMADQVIQDDLVVVGSICAGFDCVNGESFGFDTLRLKENNLRIKFQDTSSSSSFPSGDWQLTINDSVNGGANWIGFEDIDSGRTPFTILQGAPNYSIYVSSNGNIGMGTTTPLVDLVIKQGNTPTIRLEQDGSSGFAAQTWDMGGNEANFFIRDVTNGSKLPFRIVPSAPNASIYVAADGDIGFETTTPDGLFDVAHSSDANNHAFLISPVSYVGINIDNGQSINGLFEIQTTGGVSRFLVKSDGLVGVGTNTPDGVLNLNKISGQNSFVINTNGTANSTDFLVTEAGSTVIGSDSVNSLSYGSGAFIPKLEVTGAATDQILVGINSAVDKTASLVFAAANDINWWISSRNKTGVGSGATDDRLGWYNTASIEVFTVHQNGSLFIGTGTTNNNTSHIIEAVSGAHLDTAGVWQNASSRELKKGITDITSEDASLALEALNPVTYEYIVNPGEFYAGFIAEDVPDIVSSEGRKSLSPMDIVAVLTKVVKDQQKNIEKLSERIKTLETTTTKMN